MVSRDKRIAREEGETEERGGEGISVIFFRKHNSTVGTLSAIIVVARIILPRIEKQNDERSLKRL